MTALSTRDALAKALHAVQCGCVNPGLLGCSGLEPFRDDADALLDSGAVVDAATLADDEALVEQLAEDRVPAAPPYGDVRNDLRALAAALSDRDGRDEVPPPASQIEKPSCNWARCRSPRTGKCFAWCKCRCHAERRPQ